MPPPKKALLSDMPVRVLLPVLFSLVSKGFGKPGCQVHWSDPALALLTTLGPKNFSLFYPFNRSQLQREEISDSLTFNLVSIARPTKTKQLKAKN